MIAVSIFPLINSSVGSGLFLASHRSLATAHSRQLGFRVKVRLGFSRHCLILTAHSPLMNWSVGKKETAIINLSRKTIRQFELFPTRTVLTCDYIQSFTSYQLSTILSWQINQYNLLILTQSTGSFWPNECFSLRVDGRNWERNFQSSFEWAF